MKKIKSFFTKGILGILAGLMLTAGITGTDVQAARRISYNRAVLMYNNKMDYWARKNNRVKITCDLRDRSGWSCNDKGKRISVRSLYYSDYTKYVFKDVTGDRVPEAFFCNARTRTMMVLTIYKNKVKLVGTFRTSDFYPDPVRYNKKNKTFIINTMITGRSVSRNVFKIRNGKLYRVCTLSDYVAPMEANGRCKVEYRVNGRRSSRAKYNRYYKKYYRCTAKYYWGP
nr:hypothetical protein [uncultured Blautia sp.]